MGLIYQEVSGHLQLTPVPALTRAAILDEVGRLAAAQNFQPIILPFVIPTDLIEGCDVRPAHDAEFYRTLGGSTSLMLTPTTEESVIAMLRAGGLRSYRQLPMRFSHPHHVFRHIRRAEGLFKSRDFEALLFSSFDHDLPAFDASMAAFCAICSALFNKLDIETALISDSDHRVVEYLFPCDIGDRSLDKGVVANRGLARHIRQTDVKLQDRLGNVAMGYAFDRVEPMRLRFQTSDGNLKAPVMGTYGIGIQRCIYAMFQKARSGKHDAFPRCVRPFDIVLVPIDADSEELEKFLLDLAHQLDGMGHRVAVDDRVAPLSRRLKLADFLSIPLRVPVSEMDCRRGRNDVRLWQSRYQVSATDLVATLEKMLTAH